MVFFQFGFRRKSRCCLLTLSLYDVSDAFLFMNRGCLYDLGILSYMLRTTLCVQAKDSLEPQLMPSLASVKHYHLGLSCWRF